MKKTIETTFFDWCVNGNRIDLLELYDKKSNEFLPEEVSYKSNKKIIMLCSKKCGNSIEITLHNLTRNEEYIPVCKKCNSIAQFGIDNFGEKFLENYWDYNKNIDSPWEIQKSSSKRIFIYCQDKKYHGSYEISANNFYQGKRCGYCHMFKIHRLDSLAIYHINNTDKDFLEKYWGNKNTISPYEIAPTSRLKIWIKCQENPEHEEYSIRCYDFKNGKRCSYCKGNKVHISDSLGIVHPKTVMLWSDRNDSTPFDYRSYSSKYALWKCENDIHEDYSKIIRNSTRDDFRCPQCSLQRDESFLQEKIRLYLQNDLMYRLNHEYACSIVAINPINGYKLPYDNEIIGIKLLIEAMGKQHFFLESHRYKFQHPNMSPEESLEYQKWRDEYKKQYAINNGYHYLAIPYTADDSEETYKTLILNKISEIKSKQEIPNPLFLQEVI